MTEKFSAAGGCGARLAGEQVDILLTVNKTDHVILMAGKRGWNMEPGQHEAALQIDDNPPMTVIVLTGGNLVMTQIQDRATERLLRNAAVLSWRFPKGEYRAAVHDVGPVIDAVKDCNRRQSPN
jgi:hypothetical protein